MTKIVNERFAPIRIGIAQVCLDCMAYTVVIQN
jgi:hypothetical protein